MNNLMIDVSVARTLDGGKMRSIKPNAKGIYEGVPIGVIGASSRNNAFYEVQSLADALSNPASRFNKAVVEGFADGELGHPLMTGTEADFQRLAQIDKTRVSHCFTRVYVQPTKDKQYSLIMADVKPKGPYAKTLIESFEDADTCTAFSLRALCQKMGQTPEGAVIRKVLCLITFDNEGLPGYAQASDRFIGMESLGMAMIPDDPMQVLTSMQQIVGVESIVHPEIQDLLQMDAVKVYHKLNAYVGRSGLVTAEGVKSVFHELHR